MIGLRTLMVLAAIFLVAAVALGSILPADEPLSQVIADFDGSYLPDLQSFELSRLGAWAWQGLTVPVLVRPIWFIPLVLGILCLGGVTTLNWRQTPPSRRRS